MNAIRAVSLLFIATLLAAAQPPTPSFPAIDFEHRVLENGLAVYSIEDHSTPTVAVQVWYRVGSKDDPEGRSGFAHLFEHMMFKSTRNMPSEMLDRLTEDVGGWNNASTYDDYTPYYEVVPSNYLESILWAEADRMGSLTVDEANFLSERDVVKEEFRYRVLAPPYGRLYYAIVKSAFEKHPYRRPGIGSIEELDAATIGEVRAFHATHYRPDNAVLIVAGDFDPARLRKWVDRYFGPIPRPEEEIPRVDVAEPPREEERRVVERVPNVPLPAVAMTWLAPPAAHPDAPALKIAAAILGRGESSRLFQSLVYRQKIAQEVDAAAELMQDLGLFAVLAIIGSGHTPEEGEKALRTEITRLQEKLVPGEELEKAKNLLITDMLRERETGHGKAFALGTAIMLEGDPSKVNRSLAALQAVTAADVQRVARKWLRDAKPVVLSYVAGGE
ncbi:MAG TPA: pitrilysin family protein [Thermoanaerobaculia bacterium]|nr:pitrilysin family protein [Thermoanaerobaculia bacterium]